MPIYAYACESCSEEIDKLQKISDPALTECPSCGEHSLQRQLTAPNFRLSGSGWYETDFKNKNDKQKNLSDAKKDDSKEKEKSADTADKGKGSSEVKTEKKETSASSQSSTTTQSASPKASTSARKNTTPTSDKS